MKSFRNPSIQRKLAAVMLATSRLALALACVGFALYQRPTVRATMTSEFCDVAGADAKATCVARLQLGDETIRKAIEQQFFG